MSQSEPPDDGRYKSRGRKERTPEQLKVIAMAREKAKLVIQERTKIKKELAKPVPVEEPRAELPVPPPPEFIEKVSKLIWEYIKLNKLLERQDERDTFREVRYVHLRRQYARHDRTGARKRGRDQRPS